MAERYGDWAFVYSMGGNKGSAPGFKAGIEQALARRAQFLLLLDDDNVVQQGCISKLCQTFQQHSVQVGRHRLAVSAWRVGRQGWVQAATMSWRDMHSSFLSFRIQNLPAKLESLMARKAPAPELTGAEIIAPTAVYGGFFFHRDLIDFIGFPREDFCLYGDDTEFSSRLTHAGGKIILVSDARIKDVSLSWHEEYKSWASPLTWVMADPNSLVFYEFRNAVYISYHVVDRSWPALYTNTAIYMSFVMISCIFMRRWRSLRTLCLAFRDGVAGRLGESSEFPL